MTKHDKLCNVNVSNRKCSYHITVEESVYGPASADERDYGWTFLRYITLYK